jgi:hypothetical protein
LTSFKSFKDFGRPRTLTLLEYKRREKQRYFAMISIERNIFNETNKCNGTNARETLRYLNDMESKAVTGGNWVVTTAEFEQRDKSAAAIELYRHQLETLKAKLAVGIEGYNGMEAGQGGITSEEQYQLQITEKAVERLKAGQKETDDKANAIITIMHEASAGAVRTVIDAAIRQKDKTPRARLLAMMKTVRVRYTGQGDRLAITDLLRDEMTQMGVAQNVEEVRVLMSNLDLIGTEWNEE